jgi:hypothetical protein
LDGRSADNKALMCAEQRGKNVDKRHCWTGIRTRDPYP